MTLKRDQIRPGMRVRVKIVEPSGHPALQQFEGVVERFTREEGSDILWFAPGSVRGFRRVHICLGAYTVEEA